MNRKQQRSQSYLRQNETSLGRDYEINKNSGTKYMLCQMMYFRFKEILLSKENDRVSTISKCITSVQVEDIRIGIENC
jgi:hypothetical protein